MTTIAVMNDVNKYCYTKSNVDITKPRGGMSRFDATSSCVVQA